MEENENIEEKLKALGVRLGGKDVKPRTPNPRYRIEDVLKVSEEHTPLGSALVYEEFYPSEYRHGNIQLTGVENFNLIARWANLEDTASSGSQSLLFLDTETSGLSRGTGTFAFLIGIGFFKNDGFCLKQLIMADPSQEPGLLAALARFTEQYDHIVSFNGKSFDIPLLETRHILHKIPSPFQSMQHIDMLHLARKLWRNRLPSRRLGDLEEQILCVKRGKEEVPGWLVPEIYKEYLQTGDARPLAGVIYHNAVDILSLAGIFVHVAGLLNHPMQNALADLDLVAIGNLFEDMGSFETAKSIYRECLDKNLPENLYNLTIMRYAAIHKKTREWDKAVSLWQIAASNDADACIELAKYFEHKEKEYKSAIMWTQQAIDLIHNQPTKYLGYDLKNLAHRLTRIDNKRGRTAPKRNAK